MKTPSIITISGKSGCGNSTVSKLLAEKLDRRLVNYTFHTMAEEMGIPFEQLLEKAKHDDSYDKLLDKRQIEMAHETDCVLGSRLAIWLIPDAQLSVYLYVDHDTRIQRIMKREGGNFQQVQAFTKRRDEEDTVRYKNLYNIDNDSYQFADLIINATKMDPQRIVQIITAAIS